MPAVRKRRQWLPAGLPIHCAVYTLQGFADVFVASMVDALRPPAEWDLEGLCLLLHSTLNYGQPVAQLQGGKFLGGHWLRQGPRRNQGVSICCAKACWVAADSGSRGICLPAASLTLGFLCAGQPFNVSFSEAFGWFMPLLNVRPEETAAQLRHALQDGRPLPAIWESWVPSSRPKPPSFREMVSSRQEVAGPG